MKKLHTIALALLLLCSMAACSEKGEISVIKIELYPDVAPETVANFVKLAGEGFYDGLNFHRIDPDFMIQGGCPNGNGRGGPGYTIKGEFALNGFENNLSHTRGVISMARSDPPDSAGSQFFICVANPTFLDSRYAAFGKVTEGMDVVDEIANGPASGDRALEPRVMKKVTVEQTEDGRTVATLEIEG